MTPERRRWIEQAAELVCLVTDKWFSNPAWKDDVALARELKIPIVFLLKTGTRVPDGALHDVTRVIRWTTQNDLIRAAVLLRDEHGGPVNVLKGGALPRETT